MKYGIQTIYEMDVTEEEMNVIHSFCSFLDDIFDKNCESSEITDMIQAIAYRHRENLKNLGLRINITDLGEEWG